MELSFDYSYTPGTAPSKQVLVIASNVENVRSLPAVFQQGDWGMVKLSPEAPEAIGGGLIKGGINDFSRITPGQFDAVYAPQNLKGLPAHRVIPVLQDIHRSLKEGGFVLASVPDLIKIADLIIKHKVDEVIYESKIGPITALDMLFGPGPLISKGVADMEHKTAFTALTLGRSLRSAGFYNVQVFRKDMDVIAHGFKITDPNVRREEKIAIHDPEVKDRGALPDDLDQPIQPIDPSKRT